MREIRSPKEDEVPRQKEIWKRCFGDSTDYIDFFYANCYNKDETLLLLEDGEIISMLTMIPVKFVLADQRECDAAMLYAVATHPRYQGRGAATCLMESAHRHLLEKGQVFSVVVPGAPSLFDFYRKQGYREGFLVREALYTREEIMAMSGEGTGKCRISGISPQEYNRIRNEMLHGHLYVSYSDREISYQKKWSQLSGADIYRIEAEGWEGCAAVERHNIEKIVVKELLIPGKVLTTAVQQIAKELPARQYVIRTPAFWRGHLDGVIRPFGMFRNIQATECEITLLDYGYLGLAFD